MTVLVYVMTKEQTSGFSFMIIEGHLPEVSRIINMISLKFSNMFCLEIKKSDHMSIETSSKSNRVLVNIDWLTILSQAKLFKSFSTIRAFVWLLIYKHKLIMELLIPEMESMSYPNYTCKEVFSLMACFLFIRFFMLVHLFL